MVASGIIWRFSSNKLRATFLIKKVARIFFSSLPLKQRLWLETFFIELVILELILKLRELPQSAVTCMKEV